MDPVATKKDSTVEVAVLEWRHKAVHAFSLVSAIAYLPPIILMITGQAPPNGWPAQMIVVGGYLCFASCALMRNVDYRCRARILLAGGAVVALIHLVTLPYGPFGRALSAMLPILAFVFLGSRAGRIVTLASILLLMFGPWLGRLPGLVAALTLESPAEPLPLDVVLSQGTTLAALLLGQMILLERFHDFLMRSLAGLQREAGDRAKAYCNLEQEMHERQRLEYELARVADEERRRLGMDLHDGVCQQLAGALLRCAAMGRRLKRGEPLAFEELVPLSTLLEEAIDESHAVAKGLCPLEPNPDALTNALETHVSRIRESTGLFCHFTAAGDTSVPDPLKAQHLYRIAQEALSNAVRHANATRIAVRLTGKDDELVLAVEDNGKGIASENPAEGMGLRTMAYRTNLLEGQLQILPAPAGGTHIACRIPVTSIRSDSPSRRMEKKHYGN